MSDTPGLPAALKALGIVCLIIALASALMLALDHFDLARAPGCGPQSGCDRATSSAWGAVPIVNYPTSLVGVAFFAAVLAGWIMCHRSVPTIFCAAIWLGGAMSILFTIAMISGGYVCKYCLATHIANLVFVVVMEASVRKSRAAAPPPQPSPSADRRESDDRRRPREREAEPPRISAAPSVTAMVTFIVASGALAIVHVQTESRRAARAEAEQRESMARVARGDSADAGVIATTTQPDEHLKPFTGRWRLGPENAPIRIVMFFDYQCKDCQQMEAAAMSLVERRSDVSLSVKHFPMNTLCNPQAPNLHPNACWAARAAESAGILRGNDGFWAMHRWLFSQKGSFTDANFPPALQQLGYDAQQFIQTMQSQQTLDVVKADIQEGYDLGLHFTPMIFINGVELRGFNNPNALIGAVDDLAATNLPSGSPSQDQPPRAVQKYVNDWAAAAAHNIPPRANPHAIGPADARVQIVVWSDYQQPLTAELDRLIREQVKAGRDIRYEFRHYPFDQSCNSGVAQTVHPFGCMASRAAEAAGALGGNDAYWKMHDWLLAHQVALNDDLLREAARSTGVDPAALLAKMNDPAIADLVTQDAQLGRALVVQGIPTLYVNGKWAPRWKLEDADILGTIVQQASAQ